MYVFNEQTHLGLVVCVMLPFADMTNLLLMNKPRGCFQMTPLGPEMVV